MTDNKGEESDLCLPSVGTAFVVNRVASFIISAVHEAWCTSEALHKSCKPYP